MSQARSGKFGRRTILEGGAALGATPIVKISRAFAQETVTLLHGFESRDIDTNTVRIHVAVGGKGPPVLLLHGHPQTHLTWYEVAPRIAEAGYTVVAPDLRGYGDSSKPAGGGNHEDYSKRVMAQDQVGVMRALGFTRFAVVGHDRGGRVAHRMALDHPDVVERVVVLDIAPTATMYARTNKEFATRYFWWFFLIQPYDLPEHLIGLDPEYFLRKHIGGQLKTSGATNEDLFKEYLRCYRKPETIHAICEDYRAAASIDLEHDSADAQKKVTAPLLALWGQKERWARSMMFLRRGAPRRSMSEAAPSIAGTPYRKRLPTRLRPSCCNSSEVLDRKAARVTNRLSDQAVGSIQYSYGAPRRLWTLARKRNVTPGLFQGGWAMPMTRSANGPWGRLWVTGGRYLARGERQLRVALSPSPETAGLPLRLDSRHAHQISAQAERLFWQAGTHDAENFGFWNGDLRP